MAKEFSEILLDESPKSQKIISKALEKKNISQLTVNNFEKFKNEVASGKFQEFDNIGILITDDLILYYTRIINSFTLNIIPLEMIKNAYRSYMNSSEQYDFSNAYLTFELVNYRGKYLFASTLKSKYSDDIYAPVIELIKSRAVNWSRGE